MLTISFNKWSQWATAGGAVTSWLAFFGKGGPTIFFSRLSTHSFWASSAFMSRKSVFREVVLPPNGSAGPF